MIKMNDEPVRAAKLNLFLLTSRQELVKSSSFYLVISCSKCLIFNETDQLFLK